MRRLFGLLLLAVGMVAGAQEVPFDVVVAGRSQGIFTNGLTIVQWFNPDRYEFPSSLAAVASADGRTVFALLESSPLRVVRVSANRSQEPFFTGPAVFGRDAQLAVAPSGRVFVSRGPDLFVISPAGTLEATYTLADARVGWEEFAFLSVALDGCTLFYGKRSGGVGRVNGCTGEVLPDFALGTADFVSDVKPLSNGTFLVAFQDVGLEVRDASGAFVRRLIVTAPGALTAIAVARDERSVWLGVVTTPRTEIVRVSLADGTELERRSANMDWITSVVAGAGHYDVPVLSPAALALLALTLAVTAFFVLRRD